MCRQLVAGKGFLTASKRGYVVVRKQNRPQRASSRSLHAYECSRNACLEECQKVLCQRANRTRYDWGADSCRFP